MKRINVLLIISVTISLLFIACNNQPKSATQKEAAVLKEENTTYAGDSITMNAFVVYDENIKGKRPAVLVVPEWWGMNEYVKRRARELAKLGYIAMAIDLYGNGKLLETPDSAGAYAGQLYKAPQKAKIRIEAAIDKLKTYEQTDAANVAGIGYCFGGGMLLNVARLGTNIKGIVSFHGSLIGTPANKDLLKAKILVCHGSADSSVRKEQADLFKKQMDSIGANSTFKEYAGATHAFSNPDATATGEKFKMPIRYNAAADTASWNDMKIFFEDLFKR
ncbi:dienelactone hydrolase family protein [Ferruginibacter lapsinanis]|uniref:dienelactone hydrolase family protein n=1 Tax=Ferruginibacter lapsinanis TaxID=563172 RepID=UPI001E386A08|nr:dienelactone hydrolase family protein [Ferruginibacter lapsinanis]UEG50730.1 dienelactone hydrolase family protein [Ferruginibacter lapsinanis]